MKISIDPVKLNEIKVEEMETQRRVAYANESDPLYFQWQRGSGTKQEWLSKIEEIKNRYPYPTL